MHRLVLESRDWDAELVLDGNCAFLQDARRARVEWAGRARIVAEFAADGLAARLTSADGITSFFHVPCVTISGVLAIPGVLATGRSRDTGRSRAFVSRKASALAEAYVDPRVRIFPELSICR